MILLLISTLYLLLPESKPSQNSTDKLIVIPQLQIASTHKEPKINNEIAQKPENILLKLKDAVEHAKTATAQEEAKEVLATLKKRTDKIATSPKEETKVSLKVIPKKKIIKKKSTKKKIKKEHKTDKQQKPKNIKRPSTKEPKTSKPILAKQAPKKRIPSLPTKISKSTKEPVQKKLTKQKMQHKRSREEEVALYKKQYGDNLEVVEVSQVFELEESKAKLPDAYYFEPIPHETKETNQNPTKFVETLGVVEVSSEYEVSNIEIPKKEELATEGVVELKNASLETEELKKLKFVKPLEVVEVSPEFETIEAEKYIK